jgi:hypothetical protein
MMRRPFWGAAEIYLRYCFFHIDWLRAASEIATGHACAVRPFDARNTNTDTVSTVSEF